MQRDVTGTVRFIKRRIARCIRARDRAEHEAFKQYQQGRIDAYNEILAKLGEES